MGEASVEEVVEAWIPPPDLGRLPSETLDGASKNEQTEVNKTLDIVMIFRNLICSAIESRSMSETWNPVIHTCSLIGRSIDSKMGLSATDGGKSARSNKFRTGRALITTRCSRPTDFRSSNLVK